MDSIFRAAFVYVFLLLICRVSGKRTIAQITTFDLVLTLVISEAVQQAMITTDYSVVNAALLVITLVGLDIVISELKQHSSRLSKFVDGVPLVIIEDGRLHRDRMARARIDEGDVLSAARELQGLERLEQIKYAVVEVSGGISIVPWK
jgi:uncharacterized membrane protein YcaP (DUF421 family)